MEKIFLEITKQSQWTQEMRTLLPEEYLENQKIILV
jgi:hypothetical protein